jgi:hypothetical protein
MLNAQTATVIHVDFLVIRDLLLAYVTRIHLIAVVVAKAMLIVRKVLAVR